MSTPKEIFLELIRPDGQPERQLRQYEALHMCLTDPCNTYLRGNRRRGTTSVDRWGTTILFPEDAPGPMPDTREGLAVCPDIMRWRETVHAPDLEAACTEGWEACRAEARAACGPDHLLAGFLGTGIFEQCHFLMGFEDTLTNLYAHPDEMHALIDYITEYRLTYVRMLIDNLQPDVIFSHDDWGTKNALFMKPEMWREFFKEPYRRFYDSYLVPIVDDMAEIGIQVWQGVLPENDIPALQAHLNGRLTLMGGFGAAIDRKDAAPEEILTYARDVLRRDCPGGHFIPSITYGLAGTVYPHVDTYLNQAIDEYNAVLHVPDMHLPPVPRRSVHAAAAQAAPASEPEQPQGDVFARIAAALVRGQQKRVLQLCTEALDAGHDAQQILTDGLVRGMNLLGEDFSANRAFVPEMLIAAHCMAAATELLKPHMAGESSETEGSGLEVVDLGVDVTAERFVDAAVEQHCDIIACSSLLTTTMPEMRAVVELTKSRGIRDRVKIFVGGAPITQGYSDEIGADVYTEDAAAAARAAVEALNRA